MNNNHYSIFKNSKTRHDFVSNIPDLEIDSFISRLDRVTNDIGLLINLGKGKGYHCTVCGKVHKDIDYDRRITFYGASYTTGKCPVTGFTYDLVTKRKKKFWERGFVMIPRKYKGVIVFDTYHFYKVYDKDTMSFYYEGWQIAYRHLFDGEKLYPYNRGISHGYYNHDQILCYREAFAKYEQAHNYRAYLIVDKRMVRNTMLSYPDWNRFNWIYQDPDNILLSQLVNGRIEFLQSIGYEVYTQRTLFGKSFKEMFHLKYISRKQFLKMIKLCGKDFDPLIYFDYLKENLEKYGKLEDRFIYNTRYKIAHQRRIDYRNRKMRVETVTDSEKEARRTRAIAYASYFPLDKFEVIPLDTPELKDNEGKLMANCIRDGHNNVYHIKINGEDCFSLRYEDSKIKEVRTYKNGSVPENIKYKIQKLMEVA